MNRTHYASRRVRNGLFLLLSVSAALIGLAFLALILGTLVVQGTSAMSTTVFTQRTLSPGSNGPMRMVLAPSVQIPPLPVPSNTRTARTSEPSPRASEAETRYRRSVSHAVR